MEPPYITLKSPYGGFGLKTKKSEAACGRIDGLLAAHGVDVELREVDLQIVEVCPPPLSIAIAGPIDPASAGHYAGARDLRKPADELAREHGHELGDVAREAFTAFGLPRHAGAALSYRKPPAHIIWTWSITRDVARATVAFAPFCAFMHRHQALMENEYSSAVRVHGLWHFRLHSASRGVAAAPYPESRVRANLAGRHASAFFDLVFPYDAPTDDFMQDFADVCNALGMKLPPSALRLCSPTRTGGRKWTKLTLGGVGGLQSP
jgi:hypothetical protein